MAQGTTEQLSTPLLAARGIKKTYGHVEALRGVDLTVERQEIAALVGDNGAGKSTFVGAVSGALRPDEGEVILDGQPISGSSIGEAMRAGVAAVYQDLAVAPDLSVAENIFLATEHRRKGFLGKLGALDFPRMRRESEDLMRSLGIDLPSMDTPVQELSGGQRQVVAVARGVSRAAKLVIMDEPTAALGAKQTAIVAEMISATRDRGLSVLLVSHDLPAVLDIADRVLVMRQGRLVATVRTSETSVSDIVGLMLGEATRGENS